MPLKLDRGERKAVIVFGCFLVLIIVLLVVLSNSSEDDPGYPSSTSSHAKGAAAAYIVLQESGYKIQRWYESPSELPNDAQGTTLILAEPFPVGGSEEKAEIVRYINNGGRVLAIGAWAGRLLPRDGIRPLTVARTEWKSTPPGIPSRLTRGGSFEADQGYKWVAGGPDEIIHYASEDGPAVISYHFGKGEVIWWASSIPLTNGGLRKTGNLELLLNSVGDSGTHVYWDEYFHSSHHSLYATVADTPLKFLGWQFLLFAIAALATYSRRYGPLRPLPEQSRLSPLEFIETLGGLYRQFRSPGIAVEVAYDRFRHMLMKRTGLRIDAPLDLVDKVVREKLRFKDERFLEDLHRFEAARYGHNLTSREALQLVQRISQYQAELSGSKKSGGVH